MLRLLPSECLLQLPRQHKTLHTGYYVTMARARWHSNAQVRTVFVNEGALNPVLLSESHPPRVHPGPP